MISKLQNPYLTAVLGLLLSVGLGLSLSWRSLNALAEHALELRARQEPNEFKKKGWDFWTIEMENLSAELKDERERLRRKSEALEQREARVNAEEKELAKTRAEVDAVRKEIAERVIEIGNDELVNLRKLSQNYANLSPAAAVAIIREMDDNTAVKILSLMKPDVVAPIFEQMSKTNDKEGTLARRAAMLSEKLRLMKTAKPSTSP